MQPHIPIPAYLATLSLFSILLPSTTRANLTPGKASAYGLTTSAIWPFSVASDFRNFNLANAADALNYATEVDGNVVFDFGDGDILTVMNTSTLDLTDDITIA